MSSFVRFMAARFLSAFATQAIVFVAPLIVFQTTGSIAKSGLSFAIEWGIGMLALPLAGVLSDRIGGRKLYIISDLVRFVTCMIAYVLLISVKTHVFLIVSLCAGVMSFCLNQAFIALESVVPKYVKPDEIHKAQSMLQSIDQFSLLVGPVLAVAMVSIFGKYPVYLISGSVFLVSVWNLFSSRQVEAAPPLQSNQSHLADLATGAKILFGSAELKLLCAFGILVNVVSCSLLSMSAAMVTGVFHRSDAFYGGLTGAAAVGTMLTMFALPFLTRWFSLFSIAAFSVLAVGLGGLVAAFSENYWLYLGGFCLSTAFDAVAGVFVRTERVRIIPKEHLGKTLGIMVLVLVASYPLSGLIVSVFSELVGTTALLSALSVACILGGSWVFYALRKVRIPLAAIHDRQAAEG